MPASFYRIFFIAISLFTTLIYITANGESSPSKHNANQALGLFFLEEYSPDALPTLACHSLNQELESLDPVITTFTESIVAQQQHIFISYQAWQHFLLLRQEAYGVFKHHGIEKPDEQIYIESSPDQNRIPKKIQSLIKKRPVQTFEKIKQTEQSLRNSGVTVFWGASVSELQGVIDPEMYTLLVYILAYDQKEWDMYDTGYGLYYITPKNSAQKNLIATDSFIHVDNPFEVKPESVQEHWSSNLQHVFNNALTHWSFAFMGHGAPMALDVNTHNIVAGTTQEKLADALHYINHGINTRYVGIMSCHTSAERILNLLKKYHGDTSANFTIIAPVSTDIHAWSYWPLISLNNLNIPSLPNTPLERKKECSIFDVVCKAMEISADASAHHTCASLKKCLLMLSEQGGNNPSILLSGCQNMKTLKPVRASHGWHECLN